MKKLYLFFIGLGLHAMAIAQNPSYQQKLYYTCKIWGFVKYYHSNVSTCGVNWDSVLLHCLPLVKSAVTKNDFNDALDTMLNAAGPMAIATTPRADTMGPELKRNLNFGWINDTLLRTDVQIMLDTIQNNFRPHAECWVSLNPNNTEYHYDGGYLKFGKDSLILNINDYSNYPDEWHRLLEVFAHWNIINYFNPYNYIQDKPWDSTLFQNVINIDTAANDAIFFTAFTKIIHNIDDMHAQAWTYDNYCFSPGRGEYYPEIVLKHIPNKYIVVKSKISGISTGDELLSVNGLTTKQWEDSLGPYLSVGDSAAFHAEIPFYMMGQALGASITLKTVDSTNTTHTIIATCNIFTNSSWIRGYYPNDTLANVQWKYWSNCNIGYVNVGKLQISSETTMYSALQNTNAIIFDIRNYPASNAVFDLCNNYLSYPIVPADEYMAPDVNFPGTYYWVHQYFYPGTYTPYKGKVIVLFNEQALSEAEFAAMVLGELPNAVKVGSQTDGTDGNITYFSLSQQMGTGFTTLGWFYPNGDSTERVGIIPDSIVYPTQIGIRHKRDEELEKALQVAGCPLSVPSITDAKSSVIVYPNPNNGQFTISVGHPELVSGSQLTVEIYNALGQKVYDAMLKQVQHDEIIDLSTSPSGVYLFRVLDEKGNVIKADKLIISR